LLSGEIVNGVNQQWLIVDRIIAERGSESTLPGSAGSAGSSAAVAARKAMATNRLEYLVKWKELGYDACS
jgi:hypothetical protein